MSAKTWIRGAAAVAVLWNLVGVASYLAQVGVIGDGGAPPDGAPMPAAITAAFAIGTFGGVIGSVGLALLRIWARPVLWISLVALIIDWGWVLQFSGAASLPIGVTVLVIAVVLVVLAEVAARRRLLA